MLGDTEAMTRTTDIAHFYKVTTQPDPEWGSGLSAPELGKLLEGAYITSTDKTISFVVGGVGKTKCKTAWEFDAQGRMVNASTKDIKYDKFRGKNDLLILPGACPEAMGPKGLEGNIGWSDPGDVYPASCSEPRSRRPNWTRGSSPPGA